MIFFYYVVYENNLLGHLGICFPIRIISKQGNHSVESIVRDHVLFADDNVRFVA